MKDNIQNVHVFWEQYAQSDPLWAILSDPAMKNRQWDLQHFFRTGRHEMSLLFFHLNHLHIQTEKEKALDFGCGIGRVTQALAAHFKSIVGVDISETMIRLADKLNRFPGKVSYVHNQVDDLKVFPDNEFDFLYSNIVLQHLQPELTLHYLQELLRILRPGGILVFQLPSHLRPQNAMAKAAFAPMANDAYQASLRISKIPGDPVGPGTELTLDIHVHNQSRHDWIQPAYGPIRIGNHWLANDGVTMLIQDDGRSPLPEKLDANEKYTGQLLIKTPPQKGDYICEIDLVHEGIAWFKDKGTKTLRFPVRVGSKDDHFSRADIFAAEASRAVEGTPVPETRISAQDLYADLAKEVRELGPFPMHGIHSDRIVEFFKAAGAEVLRMEEDEHSGQEWIGYRYIVKKNQIPRP
ncbi:MAG: class I SAM-dependent methyltransferase [Candidatus Aminicenantes bacterium]|nr:class I SAM-dependent methyltransferase [Candidatus Aminicenantes bacterium]